MKTLGIMTQGDISLCCRGVRDSINGWRFRFYNEEIRPEAKVKRGFQYEVEEDMLKRGADRGELTRTTRASRGDFGADRNDRAGASTKTTSNILAPPELKVSLYVV